MSPKPGISRFHAKNYSNPVISGVLIVTFRRAAAATPTLTGSLNQGRYDAGAVTLQNGHVLAISGYYRARHIQPATVSELYNPSASTWSAVSNVNVLRDFPATTATLLPNGKVLVAGGCVPYPCTSAELFDPATSTWTVTGSMNQGRGYHTATLLPNGKVLVAGGCYDVCGIYVTVSAELYDPMTGKWSVTGSLQTGRAQHTATLLPTGKVLVSGGISASGTMNSNAEIYDPATGQWSPTGNMITGRRYAQAALLANGKALVMGGQATSGATLSSAELYDPASNTWSATGAMSTPRLYFVALPLPNGKILVTGGANPSVILASAELYDPVTGKWSATGSMNVARVYFFSVVLTTGQVLVGGGYPGYASAELYQP